MVHLDAPGLADLQASLRCQLGLRGDADGHDHHIRRHGKGDAVGLGLYAVGLDAGHHAGKIEADAVIVQLFVEKLGHIEIEGGHDLFQPFDQAYRFAGLPEVFCGLDADEPASHHGDPIFARLIEVGFKGLDIRYVPDGEYVFPPDAGNASRQDGAGARRQDQLVIRLVIDPAGQ